MVTFKSKSKADLPYTFSSFFPPAEEWGLKVQGLGQSNKVLGLGEAKNC